MRRHRWFATLLTLAACCVPASAQVTLSWKFVKGGKFYQETTTTLKQTTKIRGQEAMQDLEHVTITSFTVKEVNQDGTIVLEQKIESIRTSGKPEVSSGVANLLQEMQGASFTITLSRDLKITKLEGYEELLKRVARDDPATLKVVQTLMSRETLQNATEEAFAFLPKEALRPGKSWERKMTAALGPIGTVTGTHTYTYVGPKTVGGKQLQEVAIEAQLSYQPPRGDAGLLPFQISKGELQVQSGKGVLWFDNHLGRLAQSEMKMRLHGTLTIVAMGQEHTLVMEQDQSVKIRITDDPPMSK
jgi:hypothetical protein